MAINPPRWCSHAVPTLRGWEDPRTGEVFVTEEVETDVLEVPSFLTEAPVGGKSLEEMTKVELEALGRQHGIELDRRLKKDVLIEQLSDVLED
jgi:hypothetical protein